MEIASVLLFDVIITMTVETSVMNLDVPHATTLSCNVVQDLVLIKVMPVIIVHMTAIPTMMKAIALPHATTLSCNAVLDLVLIKVVPVTIAHMTAIPTMMKVIALIPAKQELFVLLQVHSHLKEQWRFAMRIFGDQCAAFHGTQVMHQLFANSLATMGALQLNTNAIMENVLVRLYDVIITMTVETSVMNLDAPHATTLSCNAVLDLVLIKVVPVTIVYMTAIPTMMKVIALIHAKLELFVLLQVHSHLKEQWRFAMRIFGDQCAAFHGTQVMHQLFANSLAIMVVHIHKMLELAVPQLVCAL
eukprot:Em0012g529a